MRTCDVEECGRKHYAKGFCNLHWQRLHRSGSVADPERVGLPERFWDKVDTSGECWTWTAATARGRGVIWTGERIEYAHRVSLTLSGTPLSADLEVDHRCRNPLCVNPEHLQQVPRKLNAENQPARTTRNSTGYRGVYPGKKAGTFYIQVTNHGRTTTRSGFRSLEEAAFAVAVLRNDLFTNSLDDE